MLIFASAHYAGVLLLAASAYFLPGPLTRRLRFDSRGERIAIRCALGLGLLSCLVMALSLARLLKPSVLFGVLGFLVVAAVLQERRLEKSSGKPHAGRPTIGAALAVLLLLAGSWLALYPTTSHDAVLYHLPAARLHIEENALAYSPHIRLNFVPQLWELLYTAALLVSDEVVANLLHYLALCLIVVTLFALGRRFFGAWAGGWAAALFLANPIGIAIAPGANNDLGLALFCLAGLAAAGVWLETHQERWLAVSGLLLGFAGSTKYTGLVFLGVAGLGVLAVSLRRRRLWPALTFLALAGLPFLPWLVRTILTTATPFGSFLGSVFGSGRLDPQDLRGLEHHMSQYGYPKTIGNLVAMPWNVVMHPERFVDPPALSKLLLAGLPFAAWGVARDRVVRALMALVLAYGTFWFFTYQNTRLLVPILPFLCLAVAAGAEGLMRPLALCLKPTLRSAALGLASILLFLPAARLLARELRGRGPLPVTHAARHAYIARFRPGYGAVRFLNDRLGGRYTLYSLFAPDLRHNAEGRVLGDWFGPAAYRKTLATIDDPVKLHSFVSGFGATHLLIAKQMFRAHLLAYAWPMSFHGKFRFLYGERGFELFEVVRPGHRFEVEVMDLVFEDPAGGASESTHWMRIGNPQTLTDKGPGGVSTIFFRSNSFNYFVYETLVAPGAAYIFGARMRSRSSPVSIDMRIEWLEETGEPIHLDGDGVMARPNWFLETTAAIAPSRARRARFAITSPTTQWVDWREFSLKRLRYVESGDARLPAPPSP